MALVFFDIDGTLLSVSSERYFIRYLSKHKILTMKQYVAFLGFTCRYFLSYRQHVFKKNKAYLYQLPKQEIIKLAQQFVIDELEAYIRCDIVNQLNEHLKKRDTVILLSGTLQAIAMALGQRFKVATISATICQFDHQKRFCFQPPIIHPFKLAKKKIAEQWCKKYQKRLDTTIAYGDTIYDVPLLNAVAKPVAVYPDKGLKRIAKKKKWQIIS